MCREAFGMTNERWLALERNPEATLTSEEMSNGWHWCPDWDFMLVNKNDKLGEGSCCTCPRS